ncbi:MAG: TIGR02206 family membrane protein [Cyanobacteria bacterium J06639_14]
MQISPLLHVVSILFVGIFCTLTVYCGVILQRQNPSCHPEKVLGYLTLLFWAVYNVYHFSPRDFIWTVSLPLQLCDITGLIAGLSFIHPQRAYRSLLYFWGLGFTTQAFIFPIGEQDPSQLRYWFYWGMHGLILTCAIFDIVVNKFKPSFSDLVISIQYGLLYVLIIFPINVLLGWNYGFIGNPDPVVPAVIALFGPWPHRVIVMVLLAIVLKTLLYLPWKFFFSSKMGYLKRTCGAD